MLMELGNGSSELVDIQRAVGVGSEKYAHKGDILSDEFDVYLTVYRVKFLIIKPNRCTNFANLFLK
jgi:hypothetical protein